MVHMYFFGSTWLCIMRCILGIIFNNVCKQQIFPYMIYAMTSFAYIVDKISQHVTRILINTFP